MDRVSNILPDCDGLDDFFCGPVSLLCLRVKCFQMDWLCLIEQHLIKGDSAVNHCCVSVSSVTLVKGRFIFEFEHI